MLRSFGTPNFLVLRLIVLENETSDLKNTVQQHCGTSPHSVHQAVVLELNITLRNIHYHIRCFHSERQEVVLEQLDGCLAYNSGR